MTQRFRIATGLTLLLLVACEPSPSPTELIVSPDFGVLPPGAVVFQAEVNHGSLDAISCNAGVCELDVSGTGAANIMGPFTWTNHIVQDFTATPCNTAPVVATLTGATGSITIADTDGTVCPIPGDQGFGFISSHWEVTGGTGEFAGISGSGTSHGPTAGAGPVVHLEGVVYY
jgi:hypothetical protein